MKTTLKRVLAFLFAFVMVVSLIPASILADESGETAVVDETVNVETPTEAPVVVPGAEEAPAEEPAEEAPTEEPAEEVPAEEAPAEDEAPVTEQKAIVINPVETPAPVEPGEGTEAGGIVIVRPTKSPATGNKITFKGNGGHRQGVVAADYTTTKTYEAGASVKISTALGSVKFIHDLSDDYSTNYRFLGWNTAQDGSGTMYASTDTITMPDSALTLYAQWDAYEWIYWNIRMGEGGDHIEYAFGSAQSFRAYCGNQGNQYGMVPAAYYSPVKAVAKEGYTFLGWYYGEQLITKGNLTIDVFRSLPQLTMETTGSVLEARFTDKIVITYTDGVDDEVVFADQVYLVEKGVATPAFEGTPAREYCEFLGWSPEVAATAEESVTYVAQWKVNIPADPSYSTSTEELFTIHCTSDAGHPDEVWHWFGSFVTYNKDKAFNEERQVWTATAKITMSQFLYQYQKDTDRTHYCTDDSGNKISTVNIPLVWSDEQNLWLPDGMTTINIWCYTEPSAPVASQITGTAIKVIDSDAARNYISYIVKKLLAGTYEIGAVTKGEDGNFWSTLTITDLQPYVDAFNTKYNKNGSKPHYVIDDEKTTATFTYTLKYTGSTLDYKQDGSGWTIEATNNTEKLNGKYLYVFSRYIITYTDGVEDEEIFADQVYKVKTDAETPAFVGTPTRENWEFTGWEPEIADTVTGDATYVAQWEKATRNKPADSKNIKNSDVKSMWISAYAVGTNVVSPLNENWSTAPSVKNMSSGISYTIGEIQGNDVDGYTTTVTFHFKSGDGLESYARNSFNNLANKSYKCPEWAGNWSYYFTSDRPADQTLTLYWVGTKTSGKWRTFDAEDGAYYNIKANVANIIKVNLAITHTVTYTDGVDGAAFANQSYTVLNGAATPAFEGTPTRGGYLFNGWKPAVDKKVYADATYVAQWKQGPANTLRLNGNGGLKNGYPTSDSYTNANYATLRSDGSEFSYPGYRFKGWNTQADGKGKTYKKGDQIPFEYAHNGEVVVLYAQWKQGPANTLRLDGNGGLKSGYPTSDSYWNSEYAIIRSDGKDFTRENYVFVGWNTEKDGSGTMYQKMDKVLFQVPHDGEILYLYAQWQGVPVTVTYTDGVDGAAFEDQVFTMHYGDAVPDFEGEPTRRGYKFGGWDVEVPEALTEDITFTAKWEAVNDSDVPKTGDDDRILRPMVLAGAMLLLCAGTAMVVVNKRKQEN